MITDDDTDRTSILSTPWLPMRELCHWRHHAEHTAGLRELMQAHIGLSTRRVILSVAHGGATADVDDVDTTRWLEGLIHGIQTASVGGLL